MGKFAVGIALFFMIALVVAFIVWIVEEEKKKKCSPQQNDVIAEGISEEENYATQVLSSSDKSELRQQMLAGMASEMYDSLFSGSPTSESEAASAFYVTITQYLLKKYNSKLQNIRVPMDKQTLHNDPTPGIPNALDNYIWWLTNTYQPQPPNSELDSEYNSTPSPGMQQCISGVVTKNSQYLEKDPSNNLFVKPGYSKTLMDQISACVINSHYMNEGINDILNELNNDLIYQ